MHRLRTGYKKPLVLFLITILVVFLLFPQFQKRPFYYMGRPLVILASGLQAVAMSVVSAISELWSGYINLVQTRTRNLQFQDEIGRLTQKNADLMEAQLENERMRQLLALKQQAPYQMLAARVIGRDPTNWYRTLMINKGEVDGVRVDMGVVAPMGVVGRVSKIGPSFSQVLLLTDRNSAIAGLIQRTRDEGIVEGDEGGMTLIRYIPLSSDAGSGDVVLTSGLAGSFPKGLVIGQISRVHRRAAVLFQEAQVVPAVDLSKLEEVAVITRLDAGPGK